MEFVIVKEMNKTIKIIGAGGLARSGKDAFCRIASKILKNNGYRVKQYSFASVLKNEVAPFLKNSCGVDVWTDNSEIKKDIRDFLVWYGTTFWRKRDNMRWVRHVETQIESDKDNIDIALISDVRYPNEVDWIQLNNKLGWVVHIKKYEIVEWTDIGELKKRFDYPPNAEEEKNDPLIENAADFRLEWEIVQDLSKLDETLIPNVKECLSKCPFLIIPNQ